MCLPGSRGNHDLRGPPCWPALPAVKIAWGGVVHVAIICRGQKASCTTKTQRHADMALLEHDPSCPRGASCRCACHRDATGEAPTVHGAPFSAIEMRPRPLAISVVKSCRAATGNARRNHPLARSATRSINVSASVAKNAETRPLVRMLKWPRTCIFSPCRRVRPDLHSRE